LASVSEQTRFCVQQLTQAIERHRHAATFAGPDHISFYCGDRTADLGDL
jgi:hypothetical protein